MYIHVHIYITTCATKTHVCVYVYVMYKNVVGDIEAQYKTYMYIYIYVTMYIDSHTAPQHLQSADWEGHAAGLFSLCLIALRGSSP